jgi:hypothetical protein
MSNGSGYGKLHMTGRRSQAIRAVRKAADSRSADSRSVPKKIDLIGRCSKAGSGASSVLSPIAPANL